MLLWKAPWGFGNIDEAFYLTIPMRLLQGDTLVVNEWHMSQFSGILLMPFCFLYQLFFQSNEGILLAFRYLYIAVQLAVSLYIYICIREKRGAWLAVVPFMLYAPFNIMALSYNSMGIQMLSAGLATLCWKELNKRKAFVSGLFFAASVLCNPYLVSVYILYAMGVLVQSLFRRESNTAVFRKEIFFSFTGGCAVLAIPTVMMLLRSPVRDILSAIPLILSDPEHPSVSIADKLRMYAEVIRYSNYLAPATMTAFAVLLAAWVLDRCFFHRKGQDLIFLASVLLTIVYLRPFRDTYVNFVLFPVCLTGFFAFITAKDKKWGLFLVFWIPGMIYTFLLHCTSNQLFYAISSASAVATIPSILLVIHRWNEVKPRLGMQKIAQVFGIVLVLATCLSLAEMRIQHTFWDETVDQLEAPIDAGVNAGVWTTWEKADRYYLLLEDTKLIREHEGNVLYYTPDTYLYLMDSKKMAAYSAWLSISGKNHSELDRLVQYYELCPEKLPDCIYLSQGAGIAPEAVLEKLGLEAEIISGQLGYTMLIQ